MEKLIVFLIIITFSIIKSMIDKAAERKAQLPRPPIVRPPAEHKARVQSEIESFLSEVKAGNAGEIMAQPGQQTVMMDVPRPQQEARSPLPQNRPQPQRNQGQSKGGGNKQKNQSQQKQQKKKKSQETVARNQAAAVGSGVREHVDQHIGQHVQQHMKNQIAEQVKNDMTGNLRRAADAKEATADAKGTNPSAVAILESLKSPIGMRQAMILNEVLSRPRALRR